MKSLQGKVALVTGAARGLGLGYARRLANMGAKIAICDLNLDSASEYEAEKKSLIDGDLEKTLQSYGTETYLAEVDATKKDEILEFVDAVAAKWGRIDIAVCNAGGGGDFSRNLPSELLDSDVQSTFERNLFSVMHTVGAVAPHMKARSSGKIITVSSFTGIRVLGTGHGSDYATAKGAVATYTRYLAQDLGPHGITANAIAPGFIATGQFTERLGKSDPERLEEWKQLSALKRVGTPDDCINLIEFLASPGSDFITGQVIAVDGGILR